MDRKRKAAVLAMVLAAAAFCDVPFTAQAAEEKAAASSWTALAGQYENPYYQEKEGAALSPKVLSEWWKVFHDDTLDELIETALANNKDLAAARARAGPGSRSLAGAAGGIATGYGCRWRTRPGPSPVRSLRAPGRSP